MPCFHPLKGYQSKVASSSGKYQVVFSPSLGFVDRPMTVPCGQCIGCRLERSRQWAIRCSHEAQLHSRNCFITLTYRDEDLPSDRSLHVDHFQKFMKRLRKRFGDGIRFYHCGEYGERFMRPHYHACLFNFDFDDKKLWKVSNGNRLYVSKALEELWPFGFSTIGEVTFESAAYVARYIMKKVTGSSSDAHYERVDPDTGQVFNLKPEYTTMSRRPGIGKGWYSQFGQFVRDHDFVVVNSKKVKPPRYYDRQFEIDYPSDFERVKVRRKLTAKKYVDNNTPARLFAREQVQLARLKLLPRTID